MNNKGFFQKLTTIGNRIPLRTVLAEIRDLKLQTLADFENGLKNYRCGDCLQAKEYFAKVAANPEDKAAVLYLERVAELESKGIPEDWSGVWAMMKK